MELMLIRPNDQKQVYGDTKEFTACESPYWAMMIAAYLRNLNHDIAILDAEAEDLSPDQTASYVTNNNPNLIGLVVTGTNLSASTWKMEGARAAAVAIRNAGYDGKIFFWGLHPSALPEQTLREEPTDFVIKGEGFQTIHQLLENLNNSDLYEKIGGLYYKEKGRIKENPEISLIQNLDELPMQAFDMVDMKKYHAHNWQTFGDDKSRRYSVISTTVGCPFQCSFCAVSALFGKKYVRYRSPEKVIAEIDILVNKYDVHFIKVLDECFVLNRKYVEQICDLLIGRNYNLNIWAYARVDTVDEKLLDKLRRAGFRWLALGIESSDQRVLSDVSKGQYSSEDTKRVVRMIQGAGIYVIANFMFGLPEDDMESMKHTLNLAREINAEWPNFYTTMAYPGSKLYMDCIKNNVPLPDSWLGYSQYSYECVPLPTKYLSGREVLAFRDYAFNAYFEDNENYFNMIREKFGEDTVKDIRGMLKKKLKRKLLEG